MHTTDMPAESEERKEEVIAYASHMPDSAIVHLNAENSAENNRKKTFSGDEPASSKGDLPAVNRSFLWPPGDSVLSMLFRRALIEQRKGEIYDNDDCISRRASLAKLFTSFTLQTSECSVCLYKQN